MDGHRNLMDLECYLLPPWVEGFITNFKREICAELHAKVAYSVRIMLDQFREEMKRLVLTLHSNKSADICRSDHHSLEMGSGKSEGSMEGYSVDISRPEPCSNCQQVAGERNRTQTQLEEALRLVARSVKSASVMQALMGKSLQIINCYKEQIKEFQARATNQEETQQKLEITLERLEIVERETLELRKDAKDTTRSRKELARCQAQLQDLRVRLDVMANVNRLLHEEVDALRVRSAELEETQQKLETALERIETMEQENLKLTNPEIDAIRTREKLRVSLADYRDLTTRYELVTQINNLLRDTKTRQDELNMPIVKNAEISEQICSKSAKDGVASLPTSNTAPFPVPTSDRVSLNLEAVDADPSNDFYSVPSSDSTEDQNNSESSVCVVPSPAASDLLPSSSPTSEQDDLKSAKLDVTSSEASDPVKSDPIDIFFHRTINQKIEAMRSIMPQY